MKEIAEMETSIAIMKAKIASFVNCRLSDDSPIKNDAEMGVIAYAMIEYLVDGKGFPDKAKPHWWNFLTESLSESIYQAEKKMP